MAIMGLQIGRELKKYFMFSALHKKSFFSWLGSNEIRAPSAEKSPGFRKL